MENEIKEEINNEGIKENKPKSNLVLIIILIGIILGLSGYIVYDKCISKEDNNKIEEKENQNQTQNEEKNIDENYAEFFTYDGEEFEIVNGEYEVINYNKNNTKFNVKIKNFKEQKKNNENIYTYDVYVNDKLVRKINSEECDGIVVSIYDKYLYYVESKYYYAIYSTILNTMKN